MTPPPKSASPVAGAPTHTPAAHHHPDPTPSRRARLLGRLGAALALGAIGLATWIFWPQVRAASESLVKRVRGEKPHHGVAAAESPRNQQAAHLAHGGQQIVLTQRAVEAMGVATRPVLPQTEPIKLELLGTTEYITETVTQVRPMFRGRADKVHVAVNQPVRKGDPLVDLYSKELAEAKNAYVVERIQWVYDQKLLDDREKLVKSNAIATVLFEETRNNAMKSRKEYEVARNKLGVYGLTDSEIEGVEQESGAQTARLTLRAPTDGYVIGRDVVPGNLYDENDVLLTVAPLDRLWVWGNVFESDLDLVHLGQSWEIGFPFLTDKALGKVEYISNRVDPNTHAVRIRTSIPNLQGRLKSDMLVRGILAIDPIDGRTEVPRTSLVVDGGRSFVFVRVPNHPDRFEHRRVDVAQEKEDHAVISSGLKAGEEVVHVGGLLLAQVYDDLRLVASGAPTAAPGEGED